MLTKFSEDEEGIGVPYPAADRPSGHRNHGYVDLKREPHKIDEIPELKDYPELREFVRRVNLPDSLFRTLGCEKAWTDSPLPGYRRGIASFVEIAFEIVPWNVRSDNFRLLHQRFMAFDAAADPPDSVVVDFEMIPASYKEHDVRGYALMAWNCGYGSTDSETRGRWAQGLEVLAEFLADESRKYKRELLKGLPTISLFPGPDEVAKAAGSAG